MADEPIRRFVVMCGINHQPAKRIRFAGRDELFDTRRAAEERCAGFEVAMCYAYHGVTFKCWVEEVQR